MRRKPTLPLAAATALLMWGCVQSETCPLASATCDPDAHIATLVTSLPDCGTYATVNNAPQDTNQAAECAVSKYAAHLPFTVRYQAVRAGATDGYALLTQDGNTFTALKFESSTTHTSLSTQSCLDPNLVAQADGTQAIACGSYGVPSLICTASPVCD